MPIDSLYQATKSSIEQSIFQLQQKIRRKNQLELERDLTDNLIQEERLYRQEKQLQDIQRIYNDNAKYNNALLQRTTHDPYVNSILYQSSLNELGQLGYLDLKDAIRREADHLEHLKRLERIQGQNLALDARVASGYGGLRYDDSLMKYASPIRQISINRSPSQSRGYSSKKSPSKVDPIYKNLQYDQPFEEDSSALLEKYNKGIRAQEYNRQMQRLLQIEKRMQKVQPKSATKSYYGPGNQSIVTPYQPTRYDLNRQAEKNKQKTPLISARGNVHEAQRTIANDQYKGLTQQKHSINENKKVQMFENEKIGEVINKKPQQKTDLRPSLGGTQRYPGFNGLDKYIKNPQTRNPILKPTSIGRPHTSKPQHNTKRQVSRSNISGLSPLKSQRTMTRRQPYEPYAKEKRPRAKSSKQRKSSNRHDASSIPARKTNSRLLPLEPLTEKVLQDIVRKNVNQSIQSRMQLINCVFRDIKMRQERNQIDNLQQRFQIQARARKEVKSMINNDPKILKKHKMVVS